MAFKTFTTSREPVTLEEFGRRIAARKAALGIPDPPRNAGKNRTALKRAAQGDRGARREVVIHAG